MRIPYNFNKGHNMKNKIFALFILIAFLFSACSSVTENKAEEISNVKDGFLEVHFIDVGQGDAILIKGEDTSMLIDAGTSENGVKITEYAKSLGIEKLDYFVGTHPHDDHLGSGAAVVRNLLPDTVFMNEEVSTAYFYEKLLDSLIENDISVTVPDIGCVYRREDFEFKFISPTIDFEDTNNNSLILMVKHNNIKMLFMADAEKRVEEELLKSNIDLSAQLLKVGHHGSRYGSNYNFLKAVNPTVAVIQSEKGNSYGHPHKETLERLEKSGINILRCDEKGNIVIKSDGNKIYYNNEELTKSENLSTITYIANRKSGKFHADWCKNLPDKKNSVYLKSREEAILRGYLPCGGCNP